MRRALTMLGLASFALLAACTHGDVAPAAPAVTVSVAATPATPAPAPAPARPPAPRAPTPCTSNADCSANAAGALCMPKPATKELADAEDFVARAMSLDDLVISLRDTSRASPITAILEQVKEDLSTYSQMAHRGVAPGKGGAPLTDAQRQDAAWLQSGATQAQESIEQFSRGLSIAPVTTDAARVSTDLAGDGTSLHLDALIRDVQTLLHDLDVVVAAIDEYAGRREADGGALGLDTGAGALAHYINPVLADVHDASSRVHASLDPSAIPRLEKDLTLLSRAHALLGKDGSSGTCLKSP